MPKLEEKLLTATGAEVRFDSTSRILYATDASIYQVSPLGVVVPRSREDLTATLQILREEKVSVVPRGGGTSLTGQSIGPGVVVDCSKYLNRIGEFEGDSVWVEPGVVLDDLNRLAGKRGMMFGPEVATASRATLGGMIGNNSAGSRSITYGRTLDHVLALEMLLPDGSTRTVDPSTDADQLMSGLSAILDTHRTAIRAAFPKILRRVSGYNLVDCLDANTVLPLLIGSEGTLGFVRKAKLRLIPKPLHRGLVVPQFSSLRAALDALAICLEFRPSAVELLDELLIRLARNQRGLADSFRLITGQPAALLMVEFVGDDAGEIESRAERLTAKLHSAGGLTDIAHVRQRDERERLWNARRSAVPLLYGIPGKRKPVTFVEDAAVPPERLPQFADDFREIIRKHGTEGAFYGHASVGCLHIRPLLDLHREDDLGRMTAIMEDVTSLVRSYGGSLSGEHGDGYVRSAQNRKMFGDEVYVAFQQVKRLFDPANLFNPGKIVDGPAMTANLRYAKAERIELIQTPTLFDYSKQEGFFNSVELCNGSGVCRKTQGGTMCPSYRATRDEVDTPRGRANAMRQVLVDGEPLSERWLHDVMDLCLGCKACKTECPSNVDVAKLKAEHQAAYYKVHMRPHGHYAAKYVDVLNRWGGRLPRFTNWLNGFETVRKLAGIDPRRTPPQFAAESFFSWFRLRPTPSGARTILLFADCLTSFTEPAIGRAAVNVLEKLGFTVELANVRCCGRAKISKGFLKEARDCVRKQTPRLHEQLRNANSIVGWEPSCVVALKDEWTELHPGEATREIASKTWLIDDFLAENLDELRKVMKPSSDMRSALYHGHCHQKAMLGTSGPMRVLNAIPGLSPKLLDTGCCGMAGMFGYERDHYEISRKIADLSFLPRMDDDKSALVVADGTSCRHQAKDLAGREAKHLIELVSDNLNGIMNGPLRTS